MSLFPPTPAQRRAADPTRSVWVTANAGTGKTRVLADRVLRLMLSGAHPEAILCLTFTKAAAAEMGARIERQLADWAVQRDEAHLRAELEELVGRPPAPRTVDRARRLFARVLDLPRGLNIMTIHAFCQALLKRFPLEAEVAPHFETIDDRTAAELMAEARQVVLADRCREDPALARAVDTLAVTLAETTLSDAVEEMLGHRHRLAAAFARHHAQGRCDGLLAQIELLLEVEAGVEPPHLVERLCADGACDGEALLAAANTLARQGTEKERERGLAVLRWLNATPAQRREYFPEYRAAFLSAEGAGRKQLCGKKLADACLAALVAEQARLLRHEDAIRAMLLARRTGALLRLGHAVIEEYERLKRRGAMLDFDDLVEHARRLLATPGRKEWVLFKLDERLEHVLVDEAQDTSPGQWAIVEELTAEFLAGEGASARTRTLFVVGDEKQSIYSFQGADLRGFREVRRRVAARAEAAGLAFAREALDLSFRSSRAVLELVDLVLARPEMAGGAVAPDEAAVPHDTSRRNAPGLVEVWPLAAHEEAGESDAPAAAWPLPDRPRIADEPERRVANAIARRVRDWLRAGELLEPEGRPIRAGDVLVLVSRRGTIQELVIRALKRAGVPVAGADRLLLGEHIAVRDLVALGRATLLPEDDLTLAALLKSPLLGLDDDQLFELAWDRGQASLLERLRERAGDGGVFGEAHERLAGWMRQADFMPPFEFYAHALGAGRGRERLLARLGRDAEEPIEAFLGQALAYERGHPATLEGFLHWLELGTQQVKRDPEQARDAVRVMTVHGAKGLEAPIVFLADAGPRSGARPGRLLWLDEDLHGGGVPLWRTAKAGRDGRSERAAEAEAARAREERQRLLYVALTRARDRLYVTGWQTRRAARDPGDPCWHEIVCAALADHPEAERFELELGKSYRGDAFRLRRGAPGSGSAAVAGEAAAEATPVPLPGWARTPAADEVAAAPRSLAPSRLADPAAAAAGDEPGPDSPAGAQARERVRHGVLVHRLLQVLPELPTGRWEEDGERLLTRLAPDLAEPARRRLLAETLAVLRLPELASAFAPGSRAEQPLCGELGGRPFAGQVDRLAVTDGSVLIVDYKTGRRPPPSAEAAPVAYLRQMAAYRALLGRVYPGREVRAALLWTQGPRLDLLPAGLLDRHAPDAGLSPA